MTGHAERNYSAWASAGASLSAVLSSACCWIPLLLLSFGASAAGVSATFERYRLPLLVLTGLLLATGFYLVYLRKPHCAPGGACSVPNPKLTRLNKGMLWVATILVAAFAFFPNYVGALFGSRQGASVEGPAVHLEIQGMTCEACAVHIEKELRSVPGVLAAEVLYEERRSIITVDRSSPPNEADLVRAVERAGYSATATREPTNTNFEAGPRSAQ